MHCGWVPESLARQLPTICGGLSWLSVEILDRRALDLGLLSFELACRPLSSLAMPKRRFAVADGAAPLRRTASGASVRNVVADVPRAADIRIVAHRYRPPTTSPQQNTNRRSAAARVKASRAAEDRTRRAVATPKASATQRVPARMSILDMLRGSACPQSAGPSRTPWAKASIFEYWPQVYVTISILNLRSESAKIHFSSVASSHDTIETETP